MYRNPISCISSQIRKPGQIIQPYNFGHDDSKKTCLWLKNLPILQNTKMIEPRMVRSDGLIKKIVDKISYLLIKIELSLNLFNLIAEAMGIKST